MWHVIAKICSFIDWLVDWLIEFHNRAFNLVLYKMQNIKLWPNGSKLKIYVEKHNH